MNIYWNEKVRLATTFGNLGILEHLFGHRARKIEGNKPKEKKGFSAQIIYLALKVWVSPSIWCRNSSVICFHVLLLFIHVILDLQKSHKNKSPFNAFTQLVNVLHSHYKIIKTKN